LTCAAWIGSRLLTCTFGDGSGAATDEALNVASALGTVFNGSVAHFLTFLKMTGTLFTSIFVGRHGIPLFLF